MHVIYDVSHNIAKVGMWCTYINMYNVYATCKIYNGEIRRSTIICTEVVVLPLFTVLYHMACNNIFCDIEGRAALGGW